MPYMLSDNGRCVHKQNANGTMGDMVKCHATPEEAAAHMRALYANVEDASAKETGPAGDYLVVEDRQMPSTFHLRVKKDGKPDHTLMGAAWAALHGGYRGNAYEGPGKQEAVAKLKRLYEDEGMPAPGAKEMLFIASDEVELSDAELQAVEQLYQDIGAGRVTLESLVEPEEATGKAYIPPRGSQVTPGADNPNRSGFQLTHGDKQERCFLHVKKLGGDEATARRICRSLFGQGANKEARQGASFTVYKQADGAYRWLAVTSSSFQDRDNEFVSQKALEADAARMNALGDYGTLDWWHTPIILGACDFSAMHGRLSVESGTFRDAYVAEKMMQGGYEMSRAFHHPITEPDAQGVYHNIKTFSRAVIPTGKGIASNRLTMFTVVQEDKEMLADKIKELIARFGGDTQAEERVQALLAEAEQKEKAATAAGLTAKEHAERTEAAPVAKPEDKPEPKEEKEKGWFVADMTPEQFADMLAKGIATAVEPVLKEMAAMKDAQAVAVKESSAQVLAAVMQEVKKLQDAQASTTAQVKDLNGLTPRGYRATQDPATITEKEGKGPGADEKKPYFEQFVNGFVLGQPQPPVR